MGASHALVLFDGVCNLCNWSVQFIIRRDKKHRFKFASLQSRAAALALKQFSLKNTGLYSILLIKNNTLYDRSDAILGIVRELDGLWPLLYIFKIVPRFVRDPLYNWISNSRYRLFGKKDQCMIPTPELKARFLE